MICAIILAVVYMTASVMSSVDILACDHAHFHSTHEESSHGHCHCCSTPLDSDSNQTYSCDHEHHLFGEDSLCVIASDVRNCSRLDVGVVLLLSAVVSDIETVNHSNGCVVIHDGHGREAWPLRAAFISHESLRAPPTMA